MTESFLSYVHRDDERDRNGITKLRDCLSNELSLLAGEDEAVWIDKSGIEWGDDWRDRIDESLLASKLFIPIITPAYFKSDACRDELFSFVSSADRLGLRELVLPIYYIEVDDFSEENDDKAVQLISRIQWEDWRQLRVKDQDSAEYREGVQRLARRIHDAQRAAERKEVPEGEIGAASSEVAGIVRLVGDVTGTRLGEGDELPNAGEADGDEESILDILAAGEAALDRLNVVTEHIGTLSEQVSEEMTKGSAQLTKSDSQNKGFAGRLAVSKRMAKNLDPIATELEDAAATFLSETLLLDPAIRMIVKIATEDEEQLKGMHSYFASLHGMAVAVEDGAEISQGFADQLRQLKKFSKDLRKPLTRIETAVLQVSDAQRLLAKWRATSADLSERAAALDEGASDMLDGPIETSAAELDPDSAGDD